MRRRSFDSQKFVPNALKGRKLRADQYGVFPGGPPPERQPDERDRIIRRHLALRAGLPSPEHLDRRYENLGNRNLPIYKHKRKIQETIRDNPISMLEGETGSGKSTQLLQFALEMGYSKIVYLVPRILLADNLADRAEYELANQLGAEQANELIGVRHSESSTGRGKKIEIMTPDTFVRVFDELEEEHANEPILVVGDEFHEKDFATDLGVAITAEALETHPLWRLVVMSATLDAPPIQRAFGESSGKEVPLVSVEGRPFNVEFIEEPDLTMAEVYAKYADQHDKAIGFTAGKQEIRDTSDDLKRLRLKDTLITPLHAKLSNRQTAKATKTVLRNGQKQVIPATNAAQSGITIPKVSFVVSDGTIRRQDLDEDGTSGLFKEYCTVDELVQQAGRGGRDTDGAIFVLCKPDDPNFEFVPIAERQAHAPAQVHHMNLANNALATAALGRDLFKLNARWLVNKVEQRRVLESYAVLYRLGALDSHNNITELGKQMNKFPVRPELARALVEAVNDGASANQIRQLAAMISAVGAGGLPYFEKGIGQAWRDDIRKESEDDYTAQLDMFLATRDLYDGEEVNETALQRRNYDLKNTRRAHRLYDKICHKLGFSPSDLPDVPTPDDLEAIRGYLTMGLFDYAHHRIPPNVANRAKTYLSVHHETAHNATPRELSNRGTYTGGDKAALVVGDPRNYEKRVKDGGLELHHSLENVIPTTIAALTRAAAWLADYADKPATMKDGRIVQTAELLFGDMVIGEATRRNRNVVHTPDTVKLLMDAAFAKPTQTVSELVTIKKRLEWLYRRTPKADALKYFPNGVLTQDWLLGKMRQVITDGVEDIITMDNALRYAVLLRENISVHTWVSKEHEKEILDRSPDFVQLSDGTSYTLNYANGGEPFISTFNLRDADILPPGDHWLLPDGREIFIKYAIGRDTKWHDIGTIKRFVNGELDEDEDDDDMVD